MCGIAGIIHRGGATGVGGEMTAMLLSLKHRGPDSTGFAVYGTSKPNEYVMRLKLAEQEDMTKDHHIRQKIRARQAEVDKLLSELGAETIEIEVGHRPCSSMDLSAVFARESLSARALGAIPSISEISA